MRRERNLLGRLAMVAAVAFLVAVPAHSQGTVEQPQVSPGLKAPLTPDLVVEDITFQIVKRTTDAMGKPCMVFNLRPVLANHGGGTGHTFRVTVQWNRGPGGIFQQACPLCQWEVHGMAAGERKTLDARQFNNCGVPGLKFRVFVDTDSGVPEANEMNNSRVESPSFLKAPPKYQRKMPPEGGAAPGGGTG